MGESDWNYVAQDKNKLRDFVKTVTNLGVTLARAISGAEDVTRCTG